MSLSPTHTVSIVEIVRRNFASGQEVTEVLVTLRFVEIWGVCLPYRSCVGEWVIWDISRGRAEPGWRSVS